MVIVDYLKRLFSRSQKISETALVAEQTDAPVELASKGKGGGKNDATYIGCVRGAKVVNLIRSTLEYAQTLGYDDVGPAERTTGGWIVNGVTYPEELDTPDQSNERALLAELEDKLPQLRAFINLTSPTNAQVIAAVKLVCRCVVLIVRLLLRRLESTT